MRLINDIIIHCTDNTPESTITLQDIRRFHMVTNGWSDIGYHYVIFPDGRVEPGRAISKIGAHCKGHNSHSIGIAYVGGRTKAGVHKDTRTWQQKAALVKLVTQLVQLYRCDVHGHHDYNKAKDCPCFDAHGEYTNIYRRTVGLPTV